MTTKSRQSQYDDQSSRQIEHNIEETRDRMDRTLEEIGDRLHPKHLLDELLGYFRSSDGSSKDYGRKAQKAGREVARKVKEHPVPALLWGAGLLWLLMEDDQEPHRRRLRRQWDDLPEHSGSFVDARTGEPYDDDYGQQLHAAWDDQYDWSTSDQDEAGWSERARSAVQEIRAALANDVLSTK